MDYFCPGVLKSWSNRCPHTTKASLIDIINEQYSIMERELVWRNCGHFMTHVENMVEAEGSFINKMVSQYEDRDLSFCFNTKY